MKKAATLGAILLSLVILTACSSNTNNKKYGSSSSSAKAMNNEITLAKYNKINVGDSTSGNGGTSEKEVKSMYGKPVSNTETETQGNKSTSYTWTNVGTSLKGSTVTAEFINGKTIGKGYTNLKNSPKISTTKYNKIKNGTNLTTVKKELGLPMSESIIGSDSTSAQTLTYSNGSKSLSFTFANNALVSKTMTNV